MIRILKFVAASLLLLTIVSAPVLATSFTEGYESTTPVSVGTVVSLAKKGSNQIENTTETNDSRVLGVVGGDGNDSIIDLQGKGSNIKVAISGDSDMLVTDIGGEIKQGDSLVISPLSGIAMKDNSDSKASKFLGVAKESFSAKSTSSKEVSVTLSNGNKKTVAVGKIQATVLITERLPGNGQKSSNLFTSLGERIAGKSVSSLRVAAATAIIISTIAITGFMLNASIKGSFVSLGRNPLARVSIITNLMRVVVIVLMLFGAGLTAAYFVLII